MSAESGEFTLEILFDKTQTTADRLGEGFPKVLDEDLASRVRLDVEADQYGFPILSMRGSLEDVDQCHGALLKHIVGRKKLRFSRLLDEPSAEVRKRAFPLVAHVEESLRAFVDHAGISILGFEKWHSFIKLVLGAEIARVRSAISDSEPALTDLECINLEQLVKLITWSASEWTANRQLSAEDILQLLSNEQSLRDARTSVEKKLRKQSAWDDVFQHVFDDPTDCRQIENDLSFAIRERNRIMHHRPMRLGVLEPLSKAERRIRELLAKATQHLSATRLDALRSALSELAVATDAMRKSQLRWPALDALVAQGMTSVIEAAAVLPGQEAVSAMGAADAFRMRETLGALNAPPALWTSLQDSVAAIMKDAWAIPTYGMQVSFGSTKPRSTNVQPTNNDATCSHEDRTPGDS